MSEAKYIFYRILLIKLDRITLRIYIKPILFLKNLLSWIYFYLISFFWFQLLRFGLIKMQNLSLFNFLLAGICHSQVIPFFHFGDFREIFLSYLFWMILKNLFWNRRLRGGGGYLKTASYHLDTGTYSKSNKRKSNT